MTKRNRAPIGSLEHDLGQLSHALTAASSGRAGVERRQRFTKDRPCPICGGYGELPRGQHRRCWGFISDEFTGYRG